MENKNLQFLQKLNSLPEEVGVYFSSDINSKIIDNLASEYNIESSLIHDVLLDFFISEFNFEKLYKNLSGEINNKDNLNDFICDFLGKLFLPVAPFIGLKVEEEIKRCKGQVANYKDHISGFNDLIDEHNLDSLGDFLDNFESDFDEKKEERMSAHFLGKDLVEVLKNNDPSASQKINGSILFSLMGKGDSLGKFTRAFLTNQEKLTKNLLLIDGKKEEPTIANWINSFVKENGSDLFNNIVLAKYLTSSVNCLEMDSSERRLVRKMLRLYRNLIFFPDSMKDIPVEDWEVIPVERDGVHLDDSMGKLKDISFAQESLDQKKKEKIKAETLLLDKKEGGGIRNEKIKKLKELGEEASEKKVPVNIKSFTDKNNKVDNLLASKISVDDKRVSEIVTNKKSTNKKKDSKFKEDERSDKIEELELMLKKYSGKKLEKKAIENEIKKLKKLK